MPCAPHAAPAPPRPRPSPRLFGLTCLFPASLQLWVDYKYTYRAGGFLGYNQARNLH